MVIYHAKKDKKVWSISDARNHPPMVHYLWKNSVNKQPVSRLENCHWALPVSYHEVLTNSCAYKPTPVTNGILCCCFARPMMYRQETLRPLLVTADRWYRDWLKPLSITRERCRWQLLPPPHCFYNECSPNTTSNSTFALLLTILQHTVLKERRQTTFLLHLTAPQSTIT